MKTGAVRKGKIEADSAKAARQRLKQRDKIIASDVKEEKTSKKGSSGGSSQGLFKKKVGISDLMVMTRQFATLQKAQVPLDESIRALTGQVEHPQLKAILADMKDSISEGKSLADAAGAYPNVFSRLYVNMVRAGESSGNLDVVLDRLAAYLEYQVKVRGQIVSAMAYPAVMILASIGVIIFLFVQIVPQLQKLFGQLKVKLPVLTEVIFGFSAFLQANWLFILIGLCIAYLLFTYWYKTPAGKRKFDSMILKMPVLGGIVTRMNVSGFTRTLSTLLSSGVPIIAALEITKNTIANQILSEVVDNAKTSVQEGESLGMTIEKSGVFPSLVSHMIRTGERTGELEQMLAHVSEAYDAEVERKISAMISVIEPVMIIVMGGIIVVVVIAILIPMLSIMSQIR